MIAIKIISLIFYFLKEVIVANLDIAKLVLLPNQTIHPALIKIPIELKTDFGIFILSSMITLTPGTLSIDVVENKKFMIVHVTHTLKSEEVIAIIKAGFEKRLLELGC